jgi:WhiB family redox-sensing transcriptional regulator
MVRGACSKNIPTDVFFSKWETHAAKMYCTSCVVRQECLDYAITNNIVDGVWGGLTPQERRRIDKQ